MKFFCRRLVCRRPAVQGQAAERVWIVDFTCIGPWVGFANFAFSFAGRLVASFLEAQAGCLATELCGEVAKQDWIEWPEAGLRFLHIQYQFPSLAPRDPLGMLCTVEAK